MAEFPIAKAWADNRYARIAGGSTEIMKEIIKRERQGSADPMVVDTQKMPMLKRGPAHRI